MKELNLEDATRIQFDYLMKRVIDSTVKDYHRKIEKRSKHEFPLADLSQTSFNQMLSVDKYEMDSISFELNGIAKVSINHEQLADALHEIPDRKREIVLMFYYLDASDEEIAKVLKINASTAYRNRKKALTEIRKMLQEDYWCEIS